MRDQEGAFGLLGHLVMHTLCMCGWKLEGNMTRKQEFDQYIDMRESLSVWKYDW